MSKNFYIYTTPSEGVQAILMSDAGPSWVGERSTEPNSGRLGFRFEIDGIPSGWGATLKVTKQDYTPVEQRGVLRLDSLGYAEFLVDDVTLLPFESRPLPKLRVRGQFFETELGSKFTAIQCSDFNLLARYSRDEDIKPILKQRQSLGFNMLRVWTLMHLSQFGIGDLDPCPYSTIKNFLKLCGRYGFYVEFTAYTSTFDPNHWLKLGEAVKGSPNVLLELVNENDQVANRIETGGFSPIEGVLCSHGSNGSGTWPVDPKWNYATFHTNGQSEEQRKVGHNAMEIWSGPTLTNETSRYPDVGMWAGAPLIKQSNLAYDSAAGAALLCAGSCFHSVNGKNSTPFDAKTIVVAKNWVEGAKSVDLNAQDGTYTHRADMEPVGILRAYQRAPFSQVVQIRSFS